MTKKVFIIFHNLKDCDSHLIMNINAKFNVKVGVIPNGLEKYMAFTINKYLEKLVKTFSDDDLKHLTQEFGSKNLNLLKEKDAYPYEYMESFERFSEKILPDKKYFYQSLKDGTTKEKVKN